MTAALVLLWLAALGAALFFGSRWHLRARARDSEEAIQRRFAEAKREIETARACGMYDMFIVNDDLQTAVTSACDAVRARMAVQ